MRAVSSSYSWTKVLLQATKLALAYQRSRAPRARTALRFFIQDQLRYFFRLLQLGPRAHFRLTHLENACAEAGLGYRNFTQLYLPPWRLDRKFSSLPTLALPPHPLISADYLAQFAKMPNGVDALNELLSHPGLPDRWIGVPLFHNSPPISSDTRIAVCLHLFYPELWPVFRDALNNITEPWDLYVSVPNYACTPSLAQIAIDHPAVRFMPCPNRGRDVFPFLLWLQSGVLDRYDAVCKLHSKRSPHVQDGMRWMEQVLQQLLGNHATIKNVIGRIRDQPNLGMVGPRSLLIEAKHPTHRGSSRQTLQNLAAKAGLTEEALQAPFFAGTMFWFRPPAMTGLRALGLQKNDFPLEMSQTDGTPAHAIERLIWPLVQQAGFQVDATGSDQSGKSPAFIAPDTVHN